MLHLEHPERVGEAWCGAEVLGVRVVERIGNVDCVVCADLRAARGRGRAGRTLPERHALTSGRTAHLNAATDRPGCLVAV